MFGGCRGQAASSRASYARPASSRQVGRSAPGRRTLPSAQIPQICALTAGPAAFAVGVQIGGSVRGFLGIRSRSAIGLTRRVWPSGAGSGVSRGRTTGRRPADRRTSQRHGVKWRRQCRAHSEDAWRDLIFTVTVAAPDIELFAGWPRYGGWPGSGCQPTGARQMLAMSVTALALPRYPSRRNPSSRVRSRL
jgi:hypothetical protein